MASQRALERAVTMACGAPADGASDAVPGPAGGVAHAATTKTLSVARTRQICRETTTGMDRKPLKPAIVPKKLNLMPPCVAPRACKITIGTPPTAAQPSPAAYRNYPPGSMKRADARGNRCVGIRPQQHIFHAEHRGAAGAAAGGAAGGAADGASDDVAGGATDGF